MVAFVLTLLVALIHVYFVYLECFAWEAPRTRKVFGTTADLARETRQMALNQGLYNGFLAAGLVFGLLSGNAGLVVFVLICVAVAGIVGAATAVRAALVAQTIPALLALAAIWIGV